MFFFSGVADEVYLSKVKGRMLIHWMPFKLEITWSG